MKFMPCPWTAAALLLFASAPAAAQILPQPRFFDEGFCWIGTLDYDNDGVTELIGKSLLGDMIVAATIGADGSRVLEGAIAKDPFDTRNLQLADIDADGQLDLVGTRFVSSFVRRTVVFYDRGNELFEDPVGIGGNTLLLTLTTGDLNQDGLVDLLLSPSTSEIGNESQPVDTFFFIAGLGNANFGARENAQNDSDAHFGAVPIALDQDGDPDFVAINETTQTLSLARSAAGLFQIEPVPNSSSGYLDLAVGDFNADGYPDVVGFRRDNIVAPANVDLYLGTMAGGLNAPITILADAPGLAADINVGDFNGDLALDLAITT